MKRHRSDNKYNAKKVKADGYTFDSKTEHGRYQELKLLLRAKEITKLEVHPVYKISAWRISGVGCGIKGEFPVTYVCDVELDFRYRDLKGRVVVEDVKGVDTALSKLKRKLVYAAHGVSVEVIKARK